MVLFSTADFRAKRFGGPGWVGLMTLAVALADAAPAVAQPSAEQAQPSKPAGGQPSAKGATGKPAASAEPQKFDIDEFEVQGAEALPQIELEEAIYPFLGPDKSPKDVEAARAALEKAYQAKGLQTVSVSVPPQNVERRVIVLKVAEMKVGRLRVQGSRYFDQEKIKAKAPSLQEGRLPDFDDVTKDIVGLNTLPDRRVTPALRAGVKPGTVDVDLNVEDKLPLHASVELNNRQTANTKPLRLSATARYENLWQLGHSVTLNYSVSPQNPKEAQSGSISYLARLPDDDRLSFLFSALKSDGVTASGAAVVNSPSTQVSARAVVTLPSRDNFFHTFNGGLDYKESKQAVTVPAGDPDDPPFVDQSPIDYVVAAGAYSATYQGEKSLTQANLDLTLGLRGLGSDQITFDEKRVGAKADFVVLKGDVSQTRDFAGGFQLYGRATGQLADQPLVPSEQFGLGGLDSVRGYLESEFVGDDGFSGAIELRSPNLATLFARASDAAPVSKDPPSEPATDPAPAPPPPAPSFLNELRVFGFVDGGRARLREALAEENDRFKAVSAGVGLNFKSFEYVNGSVVLAVPMLAGAPGVAEPDPRVLFRLWGEF
jgi:hemolysin activation/secretion protein